MFKSLKMIAMIRQLSLVLGLGSILVLLNFPVLADSIDISGVYENNISADIEYYKEDASVLTLGEIKKISEAGLFESDKKFLSFGINSKPVWLRIDLVNSKQGNLDKRLSLQTSWVDSLDVYFLFGEEVRENHRVGDRYPFSDRGHKSRYFMFDYDFPPGLTTVFIRAETLEPMSLPVFLEDIDHWEAEQTFEAYSYGFVYGGLVILIAYNLMLFFSLKSSRYFYYSVYLVVFLLINIAYTGHGFIWFWPEFVRWQTWATSILMYIYATSGFVFVMSFLGTKTTFPRAHNALLVCCLGFLLVGLFTIVNDNRALSLLIGFIFLVLFSLSTLILGWVSLLTGNRSAKYFLFGSVAHVSATLVVILTVLGLIPFSDLGYRAVEIGVILDALFLAMALGDQFRIAQEDRIRAEALSYTDPLTEVNNRRAFYEIVNPSWDTGLRKHRPMSVILLDIDKFKGVNDTYGHVQGDRALIQVAKILAEEIRPGDVLARWGGEEFVVFLPETRWEEACFMADRLRGKVSDIVFLTETEAFTLTISAGVAENDKENKFLDKLIFAADTYLFKAKDEGRDQVCGGLFSDDGRE